MKKNTMRTNRRTFVTTGIASIAGVILAGMTFGLWGADLLVPKVSERTKSGLMAAGAEENKVMSEAYWKLWNPDVQAKIDSDIEKNRKADAVLKLDGVVEGADVKVEQLTHDFIFGAHIFNFNQLGSDECNQKYKDLYGKLFNSATIAFYWKEFELEAGKPRFKEEERDTAAYWNSVKDPPKEPHWRRPATDPVVEFCESKGIRLHGHTLVWGSRNAQIPEWMFQQFCPADEKEKIAELGGEKALEKLTPAQLEEVAPKYLKEMKRLFEKRIVELAEHYGDRVYSWDVVNESATRRYGLMPRDYTYQGFKTADRVFPKDVILNINDFANNQIYANQVKDLRSKGCRIEIMGSQMHLFAPKQCLDIADGKNIETPDIVWKRMETIGKADLPIHVSEITITSPGSDERGREIQAVIARNLYRLWFSIKPMMGVTWWNVVDDCGFRGEPTISGLFTRNMEPKPSYVALDKLINNEWKTRCTVKAGAGGNVRFRGFKGRYRVTWNDASGKEKQAEFNLKMDGDGLQP
jgi:GH35 family endo-1,4-beta-xylanase